MKRFGRARGVLLAALLAGSPIAAYGQSIEDEVGGFLTMYMAAVGARDAEQIRASIVSDGRFAWIEDGEVRYRSAEDLLASLAQFPASSSIHTELTDLVVVQVGDSAAHAWARFRTTVGSGPGGFSFGGAISFVLELQEERWTLLGGHTSAPRSG